LKIQGCDRFPLHASREDQSELFNDPGQLDELRRASQTALMRAVASA
jgi:hypothetical protein